MDLLRAAPRERRAHLDPGASRRRRRRGHALTDGPGEDAAAGPRVFSVGELLGGLRNLLEDRVGRLWIVGEVSNVHRASSGHIYFSLVDDRGQIRAALFRSAARRLAFEPEEGLEVLVYGDVTVYEPRGDLQVLVRELEPRGRGALQIAFEKLRRKLEDEGLFAPERKRPLPPIPACVGIATSATGAALRDVLQVSHRRFAAASLLVAPTRVQGAGAEVEIAEALEVLGRRPEVQLILLVRGGGSLEDLQPFNTERVARAIAASPVPVVSGVGHEVDVTIADLVADLRAPTPSAAAELALPDGLVVRKRLAASGSSMTRAIRVHLRQQRARLHHESDALRALAPSARLATWRARLAASGRALERGAAARLERERAKVSQLSARLDSLSPLGVLSRGYALARRERDGAIVRAPAEAPPGERLALRVAEGELTVDVIDGRAFDNPRPAGSIAEE